MKNALQSPRGKRLTLDQKVKKAAALMTRTVRKQYADEGRKMPIWKNGRLAYVSPNAS